MVMIMPDSLNMFFVSIAYFILDNIIHYYFKFFYLFKNVNPFS